MNSTNALRTQQLTRFYSLLIFLGLGLITLANAGPVYKIGTSHWIVYSPLNVADAKGYWKEQAIEVQVINFESDSDIKTDERHHDLH